MTDEMRAAKDKMEVARKKLTENGKGKRGNAGGEATYAEAYAALCRLDPVTYRPLRGKYR